MSNADFWASVRSIVAEGFTPEGLLKLDGYAEQLNKNTVFDIAKHLEVDVRELLVSTKKQLNEQ